MKHPKQHANATTIQDASIRGSPRQLDELEHQLRFVTVVEMFTDEDLTFQPAHMPSHGRIRQWTPTPS